MKRYLLSALTFSLMAGSAAAAAPGPNPAALLSGISINNIDPAVRLQDDFSVHVNGKWLAATEIPADKSSWGSFDMLYEKIQSELRAIIETAAKDSQRVPGSDAQRIGDFYASFMDENKLEALGYIPLLPELQRINVLRDKQEIPALIAHFNQTGVSAPYAFDIGQDARDSTKYVVGLNQSGLGLPDRDYYLEADKADLRAKYLLHVEKMLSLGGDAQASQHAKDILGLETELATLQWTNVANRDPVKTYNKVALAELNGLTPGYDWTSYLAATGMAGKVSYVIVSQPSYLQGFNAVLAKTALATWQAYFQWHLLHSNAANLSQAFVDENFSFYSTTLSGVTEMEPRWKRGVAAVDAAMGESLGKLYVQQYFPAERKLRMEALVKNLLVAYRQSVATLDWMSPATKKQAQMKLTKLTVKIGYPNTWRDYSALVVTPDDLVGNAARAQAVNNQRELNKLGKPIDRAEWAMSPQMVNAYYAPTLNEIGFPASLLQPPFFEFTADDAVNYGAIGAVIGHEISHGFDNQGSQFDSDGNLRDWWMAADQKKFTAKTKRLVAQYSAYNPLPGHFVNGELTLGENIGDNSGLAIAYKAYLLSLHGKKSPVIDGLTGEQRFYMGFAQVWRSKMREALQLILLKTDVHSPSQIRGNGALRNQPGFYRAFDIKPGDKMYLPPKERVIIW